MEQKYKVKAPVGNIIAKDVMTEKELREFIPSLIQDPDQAETWIEKAKEDKVEELINWLEQAGYQISIIDTLK